MSKSDISVKHISWWVQRSSFIKYTFFISKSEISATFLLGSLFTSIRKRCQTTSTLSMCFAPLTCIHPFKQLSITQNTSLFSSYAAFIRSVSVLGSFACKLLLCDHLWHGYRLTITAMLSPLSPNSSKTVNCIQLQSRLLWVPSPIICSPRLSHWHTSLYTNNRESKLKPNNKLSLFSSPHSTPPWRFVCGTVWPSTNQRQAKGEARADWLVAEITKLKDVTIQIYRFRWTRDMGYSGRQSPITAAGLPFSSLSTILDVTLITLVSVKRGWCATLITRRADCAPEGELRVPESNVTRRTILAIALQRHLLDGRNKVWGRLGRGRHSEHFCVVPAAASNATSRRQPLLQITRKRVPAFPGQATRYRSTNSTFCSPVGTEHPPTRQAVALPLPP